MIKRPSTGNLFRPRNREIGLSRLHVGQIMSQRLRSPSGGRYDSAGVSVWDARPGKSPLGEAVLS